MRRYPIHFQLRAALCLSAGLMLATTSSAQQTEPPLPAAAASAPIVLQAWEKRREAYFSTVAALQKGDAAARKDFERVVRGFEAQPFSLTPLEAMDLLGSVFVPQVGLEKMLPVIAAQAALGLYDARRFATRVGQAELLYTESFLKKPLVMTGPEQAAASRKFFLDKPELAAMLVRQGLRLAEAEQLSPRYDVQWVTALGREGEFCPPGAECPKYELPKREQWPEIWQQVVDQVTTYYTVKPEAAQPAASGPAKP